MVRDSVLDCGSPLPFCRRRSLLRVAGQQGCLRESRSRLPQSKGSRQFPRRIHFPTSAVGSGKRLAMIANATATTSISAT